MKQATLQNACSTALKDIEMYLSGEWEGNKEGWESTAETLRNALAQAKSNYFCRRCFQTQHEAVYCAQCGRLQWL